MKKIFFAMLIGASLAGINQSFGQQSTTATPKHLLREDSAAVNALVLYPDTIREDIFEACQYPASIVSIAALQKSTSTGFADLISSYSKDDQEDFWNMSRYPDLVSRLAEGDKKSKDEINAILTDYPEDIHKAALDHGRSDYDVLKKMDALQTNTNKQFELILMDYPPITREALRELIQFPEIISLLNEHLSLAVRVGDRYRRDPQGLTQWADSMNQAVVRQNAEDTEAWKQNIEQNPDEANDLKGAAVDYAKENGYTDDEISTPTSNDYVSNYVSYPYPYWFGYPTWYPYSYWYPRPYWFDCGFYYDAYGRMVIIGTPSYYFTNWYFYYPNHWHHYPHLGDSYVNYYYGPRRSVSSNTIVVRKWVRDNKNYLPKDFTKDNSTNRVEAIRQVAQLNMDAQKQTGNKPVTPAVRQEYLKNNAGKYPALNAAPLATPQMQESQPVLPQRLQQPEKQPPVRIAKPAQQTPAPTPRNQERQPAYDFNKINKAQDYHRDVWEQTQPAPRPQQQQEAPRVQPQQQAPRAQPQVQPATRPQMQQPVNQTPTQQLSRPR